MIFSWSEYQQILPDYYLPIQLRDIKYWDGSVGASCQSVTRRIDLSSPYVSSQYSAASCTFDTYTLRTLFWVTVLWIGLHLLLISRNSMWWEVGACFLLAAGCLQMQYLRFVAVYIAPMVFSH